MIVIDRPLPPTSLPLVSATHSKECGWVTDVHSPKDEATGHKPGSLYQSTTCSTAQTPPGAAASPALPGKTFSTHTPTDMLWNNVIVFIYFFVKVVCEDQDLTDAEKVYAECGQQCPLSWEECILPHRMKRCVKIGEGTFGEVFSTTNAAGEMVALKVCALSSTLNMLHLEQRGFP